MLKKIMLCLSVIVCLAEWSFAQNEMHEAFVKRALELQEIDFSEERAKDGAKLIEEAKATSGVDTDDIQAIVHYYVGYAYQTEERWAEAEKEFKACEKIRKKRGDNMRPSNGHFLFLYIESENWKKFEKLAKQKYWDAEDEYKVDYVTVYELALESLMQAKQYDKAEAFFLKILPIKSFKTQSYRWSEDNFFYRQVYYKLKTTEERCDWVERWLTTAYKQQKEQEVIEEIQIWLLSSYWAWRGERPTIEEKKQYAEIFIRLAQKWGTDEQIERTFRYACSTILHSEKPQLTVSLHQEWFAYRQKHKERFSMVFHSLNGLTWEAQYSDVFHGENGKAIIAELKKWRKETQAEEAIEWLDHNIAYLENNLRLD